MKISLDDQKLTNKKHVVLMIKRPNSLRNIIHTILLDVPTSHLLIDCTFFIMRFVFYIFNSTVYYNIVITFIVRRDFYRQNAKDVLYNMIIGATPQHFDTLDIVFFFFNERKRNKMSSQSKTGVGEVQPHDVILYYILSRDGSLTTEYIRRL